MGWLFKGKELTEAKIKLLQKKYFGFIYLITRLEDGKIYVGKKQFVSKTKAKISKREKKATNTKKRFKINVKESNWREYTSSNQELIDDYNKLGAAAFKKEILDFCEDKRCLTYKEVWWQFEYDVLEGNTYNGNIMGRFFKPKEK
jgi:hypothetical protein